MTATAFLALKEQVPDLTARQREQLLSDLLKGPRKDWAKALRSGQASQADDCADTKMPVNQFDAEEWQWQ